MFIGFPPLSQKSFYISEFEPYQFLVIAVEAARRLNWQINAITEYGFTAQVCNKKNQPQSNLNFRITGDKAILISESTHGYLDLGHNSANIRKFNDRLIDLKYDLKIEDINHLWEDIRNHFVVADVMEVKNNPVALWKQLVQFLKLFLPHRNYIITPLVLYINILLYIIQIISGVDLFVPEDSDLITWGANLAPLTLTGQFMRLVTCLFLHIGIIHWFLNMYALIFIGAFLEPIIGSLRFGYAYILSGIVSGIISVWFHDETINLGASGAIFGIYGVLLALIATRVLKKKINSAGLISIFIFIVYNILFRNREGIDNIANVGGFLCGTITGFAVYPSLISREFRIRNILIHWLSFIVITVISMFLVIRSAYPLVSYNRIMQNFVQTEQEALGFYNLPSNISQDRILHEIDMHVLPDWRKCEQLIDSAARIRNLPEYNLENLPLLKRYCRYRIECFETIRKSKTEPIYNYDPWISEYNNKIEFIVRKLKGEDLEDNLLIVNLAPLKKKTNTVIVIDGIVKNNAELGDAKIKDISILTGESAVSLYGEKARDGAIIINTISGDQNKTK